MKRYLYLLCVYFLFVESGYGQEYPVFGQFYTNPYIINPAYVGIEGRMGMFLTHRQQWMGVEGAPVSSNFNLHGPLVAGLSGGLNVFNDSRGLTSTNVATVTAGYALAFTDKEYLRFGLSAGAGFRNFDLGAVDNPTDPALGDIVENNTFLAGNFGVSLHSGYFTLGFALPSLFDSGITPSGSSSGDLSGLSVLDQFVLNTSYRFYFGIDEFAFEPHFVYYTYKDLPSQWEAAGIFHIKYNLWAGASYRKDFGISGLLGLKIAESFSIGYCYTIPSESVSLGVATHEFQLGLLLKRNKKKDLFAISFINNERTYWGVEAEDADSFFGDESGSDLPPTGAVFDFERSDSEEDPMSVLTDDQEQTNIEEHNNPRLNLESTVSIANHELSQVDEDYIINSGERYEIIQPGNHALEIEVGYYIVVGSFEDFEDVKASRDEIRQSGHRVQYGFASQTNLWYLHIYRNESSIGVIEELNSVRDDPRFSDSWILIVE